MQVKIAKKPRKSINKIVGGQAMIQDIICNKVQDYVGETNNKQSDTICFKNKQSSKKGKSVCFWVCAAERFHKK